jgi:hypothetical protein
MTPKKLKTNKLFYGEWPYKISTGIAGSTLLRARGIEYLKKWCVTPSINSHWSKRKNIDPILLLEYLNAIEHYIALGVKLRIEHDQISIFVKDPTVYHKMIYALSKFIISVTEPADTAELEIMEGDSKIVLCNHLPKHKYQYRVVFKDMDVDTASNILEWAEKYSEDCIGIPNATRKNFSGTRGFWPSACYFYARDRSMVMMITLAAVGKIRRVEEFVPRYSINKDADQEILCQHLAKV